MFAEKAGCRPHWFVPRRGRGYPVLSRFPADSLAERGQEFAPNRGVRFCRGTCGSAVSFLVISPSNTWRSSRSPTVVLQDAAKTPPASASPGRHRRHAVRVLNGVHSDPGAMVEHGLHGVVRVDLPARERPGSHQGSSGEPFRPLGSARKSWAGKGLSGESRARPPTVRRSGRSDVDSVRRNGLPGTCPGGRHEVHHDPSGEPEWLSCSRVLSSPRRQPWAEGRLVLRPGTSGCRKGGARGRRRLLPAPLCGPEARRLRLVKRSERCYVLSEGKARTGGC